MTKEEQYQEIILQTNEWFEEIIEQLQLVIDKEKDYKISFQGKDGKMVEMPDQMKEGLFLGIKIAIETFGEFPVKISRTDGEN